MIKFSLSPPLSAKESEEWEQREGFSLSLLWSVSHGIVLFLGPSQPPQSSFDGLSKKVLSNAIAKKYAALFFMASSTLL